MRMTNIRILPILLIAGFISWPVVAQAQPEPGATEPRTIDPQRAGEAATAWERYRNGGKFLVVSNATIQYLWRDHVKPELEQPTTEILARDPGHTQLKSDFIQTLIWNWIVEPPKVPTWSEHALEAVNQAFNYEYTMKLWLSAIPGMDPVLEVMELLPGEFFHEIIRTVPEAEKTMAGGPERMAKMLAIKPWRITAAMDMIEFYSTGEEGFLQTFGEVLFNQVSTKTGQLAAASLEAVHVLVDAEVVDIPEFETKLADLASEKNQNVEVREEAKKLTRGNEVWGEIQGAMAKSREQTLKTRFPGMVGDPESIKKGIDSQVRKTINRSVQRVKKTK